MEFQPDRILLTALVALLVAVAGGTTLLLSGCGDSASAPAKEEQLYSCGMHPQVIEHKPGNCPICGMKLTPIRKQAGTKSSLAERKVKGYKSTMNPGEVSPTPRKDSMGMDMVPVYEDEAAAAESSGITIDPVTMQNMNLLTGLVTRGPLRGVVRTVGAVDFDETIQPASKCIAGSRFSRFIRRSFTAARWSTCWRSVSPPT